MTENSIGAIFFRSQPYLKEDDDPNEKDYPLIQMQPSTSLVALINIPLGQDDDSIIVGMTSYEDVRYPAARITFSYSNGLGELSVDDDRHRNLPPKYIKYTLKCINICSDIVSRLYRPVRFSSRVVFILVL